MNIVWCSWKDIKHPQAGGAEVITHNILNRLTEDGHHVTLLTAEYVGSEKTNLPYEVKRMGNRYSVYLKVYRYFKRHHTRVADVVVDEMNTIPFFISKTTKPETRAYLFVHQLCREVWFYQMKFPLSVVGYMIEPLYLRMLSSSYDGVIAMSSSTKNDLVNYGFSAKNIDIISEGIELDPVPELSEKSVNKINILSLGALRPMKRTLETVKAFHKLLENTDNHHKDIHLHIAGDDTDPYAEEVKTYLKKNIAKKYYTLHGRVSKEEKIRLMREATFITVTSVKEGWGLIVTEANSQGTPAIVYDVDGLRDSVIHQKTGMVCKPDANALASAINEIMAFDTTKYQKMRKNAWELSKGITFFQSYTDFKKIVIDKK